jgi:precorrin-6B C5,15-methyltransferase / cobalt-precorrin-6B C5,C15-methyltransferase
MTSASSQTSPTSPADVSSGRWLTIVGIGEDGLDGLSAAARLLVKQAELLVGGERHLAMVGETAGRRLAWPSPLTDALAALAAERGRRVCVLASGDPFFYGVGATLVRHFPAEEILCLPAPSSFSLMAARLGWELQSCSLVSLHGRALERIQPHLQPGARILALSWDGETPARLASLLGRLGMGASMLHVGEALGGARERLSARRAADLGSEAFDALNIVGLEVAAAPGARLLPLAPGLPDDLFEHDGQITKREIRAVTLSALMPLQGQLLWDVGAGSGSVSVEWMLRHPGNRAIAIEPRAERAGRIARNALAFGVPDLRVVHGEAPAAFAGLPAPDAVFVGGGATDPGVLDAIWAALPAGGRLVVNAVTLETQGELLQRFQRLGGELVSLQVARADRVGPYHGWRAAMPVTQWAVWKPHPDGGA